ncbi:hypothetical protein CVT25_004355 [Psilocybe cyanescens]|uniref:Uncharacterized protein n=1 Tax=Psilocybe cyanescens TaxID=93625 RepID=A0A409XQ97_PSICY|nr:hypothetical protein CVT25_004355 [Psilocybe cyanescens]
MMSSFFLFFNRDRDEYSYGVPMPGGERSCINLPDFAPGPKNLADDFISSAVPPSEYRYRRNSRDFVWHSLAQSDLNDDTSTKEGEIFLAEMNACLSNDLLMGPLNIKIKAFAAKDYHNVANGSNCSTNPVSKPLETRSSGPSIPSPTLKPSR